MLYGLEDKSIYIYVLLLWVAVYFYPMPVDLIFIVAIGYASQLAYKRKLDKKMILPLLYPTASFVFLISLYSEFGVMVLFWLLIIVAATDTGAYFAGNYEIIVFDESVNKPLFKKRFCVVENGANLGINVTRFADSKASNLNQRIEVSAISNQASLFSNLNSISLNVIQNNNFGLGIYNQKPNAAMGNKLLFQQMNLVFPGNNEFYYFDNKNMNQPFDMVAAANSNDEGNHTYLHSVWAFPLNYQYQPDVNGAFYFRRNDLGIERNADTEADYSWVYFSLDSEKTEKEIYVLGAFNDFIPSEENKMSYDEDAKKYIARIYLKQGFYNYILATKDATGFIDLGEINGNFWQTENLYQAFLYYAPFDRNYDGLIGYGETRKR
jgi:hypothetical protein